MATIVSDHAAYEVLLTHLSPADHANLRLVCRSWQALVDRSLGCLHPFSITPLNFGFGSVTCLAYKSLFQSSSVRHHALDGRPSHGFQAIARQFTALHTLAVDCVSKCCGDFGSLQYMQQLRRLKLNQFPFTDEAFRDGMAQCYGLQVLHLECHRSMLHVSSLRYLSGLVNLQELVLKPRGYINVPSESAAGMSALAQLTRLTQLLLVAALKPSRSLAGGSDAGSLPSALPDLSGHAAGGPVYFDALATHRLFASLGSMKVLKVLRLAGVATLPASVSGLTQLKELSLERVGHLDRAAVASLQTLRLLSALTIITAADLGGVHSLQSHQQHMYHTPLQQQQQYQDPMHWDPLLDGPGAAAGGTAAAAAMGGGVEFGGLGYSGTASAAAAAYGAQNRDSSMDSLWLPLLLLPSLQELVVGSVCRGQTLNLTTTLTDGLMPPEYKSYGSSMQGLSGWPHSSSSSSGIGTSQQSGAADHSVFSQGVGGQRYSAQEGASVSAYVCPTQWSDLADTKGLGHIVVEARGWHSAAITAKFNSITDAIRSFITWPSMGPAAPLVNAAPAAASQMLATPAAAAVAAALPASQAAAAAPAPAAPQLAEAAVHAGVPAGAAARDIEAAVAATAAAAVQAVIAANARAPEVARNELVSSESTTAAVPAAGASSGCPRQQVGMLAIAVAAAKDICGDAVADGTRHVAGVDQASTSRTNSSSSGGNSSTSSGSCSQHIPAAATAANSVVSPLPRQSSMHSFPNQLSIALSAPKAAAARSSAFSATAAAATASAGAVGVFINHPSQGCYLPMLPQLIVLALRPSMGQLGQMQRYLVRQCLMQVQQQQQQQQGHHNHFWSFANPQLPGAVSGGVPCPESPARRLLLAQLRASMHPSKLLIVLAASATTLTRLEVTVDQSWPAGVLGSLGQLSRLPHLTVLKLDCGRQDPPPDMWAGLSSLINLRWLCLRWLEAVPVTYLAPLTQLVALQLKAISKPPGAAELAEVLSGMPHLAALAIEGGLLDVEGDWLRDTAGLIRHGRWTSSWVEHTLCRQQHLRILGSMTAALLMAVALNSPKWPEMILTAMLAAAVGTVFVLAVTYSLMMLMLDNCQVSKAAEAKDPAGVLAAVLPPGISTDSSAVASAAANQAAQTDNSSNSSRQHTWITWAVGLVSFWRSGIGWWLGRWYLCFWIDLALGWLHLIQVCWAWVWNTVVLRLPFASLLTAAADKVARFTGASSASSISRSNSTASVISQAVSLDSAVMISQHGQTAAVAAIAAATATAAQTAATAGLTPRGGVVDPGAAFRQLRFLSLRRCTLTRRSSSLSNSMWQLSSFTSQLSPGFGSQLVAILLGILLWPLAAGGALSRIVASSSYQPGVSGLVGSWAGLIGVGGNSSGGSSSIRTGGSSSRGRGRFAGWGWYWDELCGLLQAAANRVEVAAVGRGSALVSLVSGMPELRFLDVTWLNLEPWELQAVAQLRQLHYLGLGKQQVGVVMSQEALLARSCRRGWGRKVFRSSLGGNSNSNGGNATAAFGGIAGSATAAAGRCGSSRTLGGWLLSPAWCMSMIRWCFVVVCLGVLSRLPGFSRLSALFSGHNVARGGRVSALNVAAGGVLDDDFGWLDDTGPNMMLIEAPTGFDEVIEREIMTTAAV